MKKIQVFGTGCSKCNQLETNAKAAIEQLGIEAEIIKVRDINEIAEAGVLVTPALAVNGEIKVSRKVATTEEIASWLQA